jgi:hypothetical protein
VLEADCDLAARPFYGVGTEGHTDDEGLSDYLK